MNQCFAECRKTTQDNAFQQVYYPDDAEIVPGECVEPCLGVVCDPGYFCSSQGEDAAKCVPLEVEICKEEYVPILLHTAHGTISKYTAHRTTTTAQRPPHTHNDHRHGTVHERPK